MNSMSNKVSRRSVMKLIVMAGAALATLPLIGRVSAVPQSSSPAVASTERPAGGASDQVSGLPLVVVVKGNTVMGYRGLQEMSVEDDSLASILKGAFSSIGGSS